MSVLAVILLFQVVLASATAETVGTRIPSGLSRISFGLSFCYPNHSQGSRSSPSGRCSFFAFFECLQLCRTALEKIVRLSTNAGERHVCARTVLAAMAEEPMHIVDSMSPRKKPRVAHSKKLEVLKAAAQPLLNPDFLPTLPDFNIPGEEPVVLYQEPGTSMDTS